jgi:hypothetical protein
MTLRRDERWEEDKAGCVGREFGQRLCCDRSADTSDAISKCRYSGPGRLLSIGGSEWEDLMPEGVIRELDEILHRFGTDAALSNYQSHLLTKCFAEKCADVDTFLPEQREDRNGTGGTLRTMRAGGLWAAPVTFDLTKDENATIAIGATGFADEEYIEALKECLNGAHLWLLVHGYEAFERFICDTYAAIGKEDARLWKAKDFGSILLRDCDAQDEEWYKEKAQQLRRQGIKKILSTLRKDFPFIERRENDNHQNVEVAFWTNAIEGIRHFVVHYGGTGPTDEFWKVMEKATGYRLTRTQEDSDAHIAIAQFVDAAEENTSVCLVDRQDLPQNHSVTCRNFRILHQSLTSHAALIYAAAVGHFGGVSIWDRTE